MSVFVDKYTDYIPVGPKRATWLGFMKPRDRVAITCVNGRTKQEFKDECDLNVLMKKYEKTGVLPPARGQPRYVDAFDLPSYQEALTVLSEADRAFMALPARVRGEFDNDPEKFVAFASDPQNVDRLRSLGLADPVPPAPEPVSVRVVDPPAPEKDA